MRTDFQRRSGDVMTFIGNTIITMVALAYTNPYDKAIGGVFGGDDSLVFFDTDVIVPDSSQRIANVFNLTAKIEIADSMYFASKFVLVVAG